MEDHREPTLRNKKQVMCLSADDCETKKQVMWVVAAAREIKDKQCDFWNAHAK